MEKKITRSERMRFMRNFIKLKEQGEFIEKSIETFVMGMKLNVDIIQDLIGTRRECAIERREIIDPLYRSALEVSNDLAKVKSTIDRFQAGKKIDPEEIKLMLLSLSRKLDNFKFNDELVALEVEQKEIEDYLHEFRVKMEKYEKSKSTTVNYNVSFSNNKKCETTDYDGIGDFNALVAKTGHTQHWKEEDHLFFLKIRKKKQSVPAMVLEIQKICPDLSAREIVNHEAWYKVYLDLREKQRKSVKEWRKRRESEKNKKIEELKFNDNNEDNNNLAEKSVKNEGNRLSAENSRVCKISKAKICENEKKEMIKKWKIEKENAKIADEERLKNQNEGLCSWREQHFLLRTIEIKAALDEYRAKKMQQEFSNNQNKKKNKIIKSPGLIRSFRKQDQMYLQKRKSILNSKSRKNENHKINANSPMRSRSGSTLMKPTKIWEEKCKQRVTHEQSPKEIMYIKNLPKLSTFNWKNQESIISL